MLVSPAFLASDFIVKHELASLLEGVAREGVPIFWIPVRHSRYTAAEPLLQRALAVSEALMGPEHLRTADSLNRLAGLYYAQGKLAEEVLGPEHPYSVTCRENLVSLRAEIEGQ